jgi:hypothetical protein
MWRRLESVLPFSLCTCSDKAIDDVLVVNVKALLVFFSRAPDTVASVLSGTRVTLTHPLFIFVYIEINNMHIKL